MERVVIAWTRVLFDACWGEPALASDPLNGQGLIGRKTVCRVLDGQSACLPVSLLFLAS